MDELIIQGSDDSVPHVPDTTGWIEVIAGSMFSGKSEELIRRLRRAKIARQKVQVFKPEIDMRFSNDHIVSHSEMRHESANIRTAAELLARIESDERIASILNRNRRRTAHGQNWTGKRICSLRNNHAIPVYREGERQARGEMSVSESAAALGVTPTTVLRLIRVKQLPATQACVGAPWILRSGDVKRCVAERNHPVTPPMVDSAQLILEMS